jgi:AraC-like DNA-binding protein
LGYFSGGVADRGVHAQTAVMQAARNGRRREPLHAHTIIETTDVDDAEQALSRTFLPLRLRPEPGPASLDTRLNAITVARTTVGYLRFGVDIRIVTDETTNYHIGVPLAGRSRSRAGTGDEVLAAPGSAAVYMPGAPVDLTWTSDTEQLCLMLDPADVQRELTQLLGRDLPDPVVFAEKMNLRDPTGRAWMHTLRLIDAASTPETGMLQHRLTARRLEQILILGLLLGHQHNHSERLTAEPASPAARATRRAVELLHGRPEHPWTTSELAAAVAVSAHSLQTGFRAHTGKTPMAYLNSVRLEQAHHDLTLADPHRTTVGHIAHSWGFLHLGRFASAYQYRYGQPPSHTLRRND